MEPYYLKRHGSFATPIIIALSQNEVTVGRKETPDLKNGPNVSRSHAMFLRSFNGQWYVKDMKSTNGVFVNSEKIGTGLYTVNLGDVIGLGAPTGDSERDYVFIMCNNRTLSLASSPAIDDGQNHSAENGCSVIGSSASNYAGSSHNVAYNAECSTALACRERNSLPVFHANDVSGNHIRLNIKKEVDKEEHKTADGEKPENNHFTKTVNQVFIKKERPESPVDNLCNSVLSSIDQNISDSVLHPLLVDSANYKGKSALADAVKNVSGLSGENCKHKRIFEVPNSSLKPSGSAVSLNTVIKRENNCSSQSRSPQNEKYEVKQSPSLKELKVVLKKYDNIVVETYEIEKHGAESDTSSSCSDVIPHKQRGRRLRINSSSLDESEEDCVSHSHKKADHIVSLSSGESRHHVVEKLCETSNEHAQIETYRGGGHQAPLSPVINSCTTINITSALSTADANSQSYTQEDEIIIISSDDEDYDYMKNPVPVKIKTEPVENDDLSNSEWQYVSNSQEVKDENPSDSETENVPENVPCPDSVLNSSALRTSLVTDHHKHVDNGTALENLQWEHTAEMDDNVSEEDDLLNASENIENITKFLFNTGNNRSLPKKTLNGSNSGKAASKTEINDFSHPLAQPLLSSELKGLSASYSDHVELQNEEKHQKPVSKNFKIPSISENRQLQNEEKHQKPVSKNFKIPSISKNRQLQNEEKHQKPVSKNFKIPSISENRQKTLSAREGKESSNSSKNMDSGISPHSKCLDNQKQSSENFDRSYFSATHRPLYLEEGKANSSKKSTEDVLNDFCKRQKEKTLSKTVLTEAMPIQYRSRYKRGREEWFRDHYDDDKPTENKVVSKQGKVQKSTESNSKNKAGSSAIRHKDSKSKASVTVRKRRRSKHNKNSSLRDQMQSMYLTIPFRTKSSAPVVASSSDKQTFKSANHEKNISFPVKRKLPTDETVVESVKERRVVIKKKERFTSRMSFLTDGVVAEDTNPPNVDALRSKKALSLHLTEKSYRRVSSSGSGTEVANQRKKSTEQPSVLKMSQVPKHNTHTLSSSHVHGKNPLMSDCYNPQISTESNVSGSHVPAMNYSSDPRFQMISRSHVAGTNSSTSGSSYADPRQYTKTFDTVSHSSKKNVSTFASAAQTSNIGVDVSQKFSRSEPLPKLTVKLNSETFILNILSWMPAWLREQQSMNNPPPVVDWTKIQPLKLCYNFFVDYALSFYNLLLVEMWESLLQSWKEKRINSDFFFVVTNYCENSDLLTFDCEALLSERMSHIPVEGTLLIIDLRLAENKVLKLFGYTNYCKFQTISEIAELHTELRKLPEAKEQNPRYCRFKFQTKTKKLSLCLNKRMRGCVLSYISVSLRIVNSLVSLQSSPLIKDVLCPQEKNCTISSILPPSMPILKTYNKAQASAIVAISDEMRKVYSVPRILLLQGPPGTGKTHVIIGIIENLLSKKHEKIKILVTAPSNAAADEIGRRLIALRRHQSYTNTPPLCFVRVGIPNQIHRDVSPFSLDSLVQSTFKKTWDHQIKKTEATLSDINTKKKCLEQKILSLKLQNMPQQNIQNKQRELSMLKRRAELCELEICNLKNKTVRQSSSSVYQTKLNVLKNADVILSTLSSCRQSILENSFGKKSDVHFTCCIIDEASQCTEPEALQPLTYGMCKLLLVGDHQQLPATVRSRVAVENHLDRSLFERIHMYFNRTLGRSPVYMLTEQYRMHSEICSFPSFHFYSHCLKTAPEINSKYESFPLKPYFFLNVAYSKESNVQKSKTNVLEAEIIIHLCIALVKICSPNCSIGVITPYQGQKMIYETAFSRHASCQNIEVNTVDSFQGREKDLVIISCVRARSQDGSIGFLSSQKRLNVAITRAAKCLLICGHSASLEEQPGWSSLISDASHRKLLIPVTSVDDIPFILKEIRKPLL